MLLFLLLLFLEHGVHVHWSGLEQRVIDEAIYPPCVTADGQHFQHFL